MASSHIKQQLDGWTEELRVQEAYNIKDDPNYYSSNPKTLITTSQPANFGVGTGAQILSKAFSSCFSTEHELIIVTCFWTKSTSQQQLVALLLKISAKAVAQERKIQVRLCFSSRSIWQKLTQTASLEGEIYPSTSWSKLGLPLPEEIAGINLIVKSVFVRPFSVMHPKFILMDRKLAFMPSCNVSWEDWYEGCIEMKGEICGKLFDFWNAFWSRGAPALLDFQTSTIDNLEIDSSVDSTRNDSRRALLSHTSFSLQDTIPTILLPSPHHQSPRFRPYQCTIPKAPPTPLNTFLLHIFANAQNNIFLQTPNLTSFPVIEALFSALRRGVNVEIITSSVLMIFEQLGTAGSITEFEVWKLRRRYRRLLENYESTANSDLEAQIMQPGILKIGYYHPKQTTDTSSMSEEEPNKAHLKLTIVDDEIVVLGSGNMDRASWYTSQELGVAFFSNEMAMQIRDCTTKGLRGRVKVS